MHIALNLAHLSCEDQAYVERSLLISDIFLQITRKIIHSSHLKEQEWKNLIRKLMIQKILVYYCHPQFFSISICLPQRISEKPLISDLKPKQYERNQGVFCSKTKLQTAWINVIIGLSPFPKQIASNLYLYSNEQKLLDK